MGFDMSQKFAREHMLNGQVQISFAPESRGITDTQLELGCCRRNIAWWLIENPEDLDTYCM